MTKLIRSYVDCTAKDPDAKILLEMDNICPYGLESLEQDDLASFIILLTENVFETQQTYVEENVLCDGTGSTFWHYALQLSDIAKIQLCAGMIEHLLERKAVELQSMFYEI